MSGNGNGKGRLGHLSVVDGNNNDAAEDAAKDFAKLIDENQVNAAIGIVWTKDDILHVIMACERIVEVLGLMERAKTIVQTDEDYEDFDGGA